MHSNITVKKLLDGQIDQKYDDKVFWYASEVVIKDNNIQIFIKNSNLVTFDDIDLNIKKISDFRKNTQDTTNKLKNVLVSSGSFLFINDKLAVTQRELTTKYDPGFWTTPAGRCDRTILITGLKETIEEIEIKQNGKLLYPDITKELVSNKDVTFYKTSFEDKNLPLKTYNINLYLDNILIEQCKSWMMFSKKANTIEFRIPIFAELNEENLEFRNPEFNTATGLKTLKELKQLQCVPALKQLLKEIQQ